MIGDDDDDDDWSVVYQHLLLEEEEEEEEEAKETGRDPHRRVVVDAAADDKKKHLSGHGVFCLCLGLGPGFGDVVDPGPSDRLRESALSSRMENGVTNQPIRNNAALWAPEYWKYTIFILNDTTRGCTI